MIFEFHFFEPTGVEVDKLIVVAPSKRNASEAFEKAIKLLPYGHPIHQIESSIIMVIEDSETAKVTWYIRQRVG